MGGYDGVGGKNDTWRSTNNGATWTLMNASSGWTVRWVHTSVIFKVNPDFGELETVGTILVSKANNKFRFGFAPDMVNDISSDIHLDTNLKTHSSFTDEDRLFLPDMIDNHMVFEFTVDNSKSRQVKIQTINVNFDQNIT
jgi:hypothetical protein